MCIVLQPQGAEFICGGYWSCIWCYCLWIVRAPKSISLSSHNTNTIMHSLIEHLNVWFIFKAGRSNYALSLLIFFLLSHIIFSCGRWVFYCHFICLWIVLRRWFLTPLAHIFQKFPPNLLDKHLKRADSGLLEMDWLRDDNLMNFCIYECCNWGSTSLLINYSWWKCGKGDSSVHNEARWYRCNLIKKCCDKRRMYPHSQS